MSYQISKVTQMTGKASDTAMKNELDIGKLILKITDIRLNLIDVSDRNRRNNLRFKGIREKAENTDLIG